MHPVCFCSSHYRLNYRLLPIALPPNAFIGYLTGILLWVDVVITSKNQMSLLDVMNYMCLNVIA